MESPTAEAVPAQPETDLQTVSATIAASNDGNLPAFQAARHAEREGKPLPPVVATPVDGAAPERKISNRQAQINDYERRIAEQNERIARLEGRIAAPPAPPAAPRAESVTPPAAPAPKDPEWKAYAARPDAPKLEDFESFADYSAANAHFIAKAMLADQQTDAEHRSADAARAADLSQRTDRFVERLAKAKEADPEFLSKIPPAIATARPLSALAKGERATFANVVAEAAFLSEQPGVLLTHMHAHPDEITQIADLPTDEWLPALKYLDRRLAGASVPNPPAAVPAAAPLSSISSAPPPPPVITRPGSTADPESSALARKDVSGYLAARKAKRMAANA